MQITGVSKENGHLQYQFGENGDWGSALATFRHFSTTSNHFDNLAILCFNLDFSLQYVTECWDLFSHLFWDVIICILFSFGGVGIEFYLCH